MIREIPCEKCYQYFMEEKFVGFLFQKKESYVLMNKEGYFFYKGEGKFTGDFHALLKEDEERI